MDNTTPDNTPKLATVTPIADARKTKATQDEVAELEVSGPQTIKLQGDEWLVNACDGEQVYVWLVRKKTSRSKGYTMTEVYPGLTKKRTKLRNAKTPIELEIECKVPRTTMADVLEDLEDIIFEDFEEDSDGTYDDENT